MESNKPAGRKSTTGGETRSCTSSWSNPTGKWSEIKRLCSSLPPGKVVLIDRCWVSNSSVKSARTGVAPEWPADFRPDVVFTIRVDEKLRRERILARDGGIDNLNDRERQLIEDEDFRNGILRAELELGCTPLRMGEVAGGGSDESPPEPARQEGLHSCLRV